MAAKAFKERRVVCYVVLCSRGGGSGLLFSTALVVVEQARLSKRGAADQFKFLGLT